MRCHKFNARFVPAHSSTIALTPSNISVTHASPQAYFDNPNVTAPEVRRGLNSIFANDLVPEASILTSALKATRRVNDFATYVAYC